MKLEINQPNKCGKCMNLTVLSNTGHSACPVVYEKMKQHTEQMLANKNNSADAVPNLMYEAYSQCLCGCDKFTDTGLDSEVCSSVLSIIAFKLICDQLSKELQDDYLQH